jgi:2-polyprenyl-6-hydroxyphenyl methylase/3-demethylubiquinone-9 3-methyltransferase
MAPQSSSDRTVPRDGQAQTMPPAQPPGTNALRRPRNDPAQRPRNDPAQYDDLAAAWEDPRGPFAMLGWLAAARATLIPPAARPDAVLLDLACGGGLLAPSVARLGYRHVGFDLSGTALAIATRRGVTAIRADVTRLPVADAVADVVVAGEILEHVADPAGVVAEAARALRPGGTLVVDTIADTALARLVAVRLAERVRGGPPPGLHDPALLVDRAALVRTAAEHGIALRLTGLRPSARGWLRWLAGRPGNVAMHPTRSTAVLFTGVGRKAGSAPAARS